jgi:hypothetical protein
MTDLRGSRGFLEYPAAIIRPFREAAAVGLPDNSMDCIDHLIAGSVMIICPAPCTMGRLLPGAQAMSRSAIR